jgi:hypothetical protein
MIKIKTYYLLFFTSLILLMLGFLVEEETTTDVNVHDTYFVIANSYFYWFFSILLFFFFTIYFSLDKAKMILFRILYRMHIFGTLISVFGLFFPYSMVFTTSKFPLFDNMQYINNSIVISFFLFLFSQLLFLINIFATLIKRLRLFKSRQ